MRKYNVEYIIKIWKYFKQMLLCKGSYWFLKNIIKYTLYKLKKNEN